MTEQLNANTSEVKETTDMEAAIAAGKALLERTVTVAPGLKPEQPTQRDDEPELIETEPVPGVYEVYDKKTGELVDIGGEGEE